MSFKPMSFQPMSFQPMSFRPVSLQPVDGIDFADRSSTGVAPSFLLGTNSAGLWVIRETTGRKAGLFLTREAAIRYARDESADGHCTIVYHPEGLEFETSHPRGLTAPGGFHVSRR